MSLSVESSAKCESAIVEEYITKLRKSLVCQCTLVIDNVLLLRLARWTGVGTSRSSQYAMGCLSVCHSFESNCTAVAQLQLPEVASTLTLRSVQACEGIVGWLSHESCKRSRRPSSTGQGSVHHTSTDTPARQMVRQSPHCCLVIWPQLSLRHASLLSLSLYKTEAFHGNTAVENTKRSSSSVALEVEF